MVEMGGARTAEPVCVAISSTKFITITALFLVVLLRVTHRSGRRVPLRGTAAVQAAGRRGNRGLVGGIRGGGSGALLHRFFI